MKKSSNQTNNSHIINNFDYLNKDSMHLVEKLSVKNYYLRELAEETTFSPSHVHKLIALLSKKGIITSIKKKNTKILQLERKNPLTKELLRLLILTKILSSKGLQELIKLGAESICLYGSCARGEQDAKSDIDIAVILEKKIPLFSISKIKLPWQSEMHGEMQIIALDKEKIASTIDEEPEILKNIRTGILLYGKPI